LKSHPLEWYFAMMQQRFRDFLQAKLEEALKSESERDRRRLMREFFFAVLSEVAEDVLDLEIAPMDGAPAQPNFEVRSDSQDYDYHTARANAFRSFDETQIKILRAVAMHTAFGVLDGILHTLDFMPGFETEIRLQSRQDPTFNVILRSAETDELQYGRSGLPQGLTKYEY
jgi:hypothetical protein